MSRLLTLALSTLSLVSVTSATPWAKLVQYASTACTCTPAGRGTSTTFTSQEGFSFTLTSALTGDCTNPVTAFTLTAATQELTQAQFFVEYSGQCNPATTDCSQVRCQAQSSGSSSLSCSFPQPPGFTAQQYVYVLWQTTAAAGNRQYPLPAPAFIPINLDCSSSATPYSATCNNGVCGCATGDSGSSCPTVAPTTPPTVAATSAPTVAVTSAPTVATSAPTTATTSGTTSAPPPPVTVSTPPPSTYTGTTAVPPTSAPTGPRLIFSDEFTRLDNSVWEHEITLAGDGNWSFQQYANNRTNTFVRNGTLYIKPTFTSAVIGEDAVTGAVSYTLDLDALEPAAQCTGPAFYGCSRTSTPTNYLNPIQSAAIRTVNSFTFTYGTIEIRAKLPRGDWIWPAIWLLPRYDQYGQWPMSGEIDIVESRGNAPGYSAGGNDVMASTLHWGPYFPEDRWDLTHQAYQLPAGESFADDFHTFGCVWDATGIYTYVDSPSNRVLSANWSSTDLYSQGGFQQNVNASNPWVGGTQAAPFDEEFYLIFDVAVGGALPGQRGGADYFPVGPDRPWNDDGLAINDFWDARASWLPTWQGDDVALQIDWVRVWQ